jgi:HAD superfamily hydrolase (TIGR01509 family)
VSNSEQVPSAVIFDMDGVLLDSEPLHFAALNEILGREGFSLSETDNEHILGTTLEGTFLYLTSAFTLSQAPSAYHDVYNETILRVLAQPLDPTPGAVNLLERLEAAGVRLALASSSQRQWVEATLCSLGIERFFEVVVTGSDVEEGKPDPTIYRLAAQRLGLTPDSCVAIEDAPKGIQSAKRAGMRVIALVTPYTQHLDISAADAAIHALFEAEDIILGTGSC